jgi:hypothetical protein
VTTLTGFTWMRFRSNKRGILWRWSWTSGFHYHSKDNQLLKKRAAQWYWFVNLNSESVL